MDLAAKFASENANMGGGDNGGSTQNQQAPEGGAETSDPDPKGGSDAPPAPPADIDDAAFMAAASKRFGAEFKSIDELKGHFFAESEKSRPELVRRFEDYFTLKGGNVSPEDFVEAVQIANLDLSKMEDTDALKTAFSLKEGLKGADLEARFGSHIRTSFGREIDVKGAEKSVEGAKAALKAAKEAGDDTDDLQAALDRAEQELKVRQEDAADRQYKIAEASKAAKAQIAEAQKKLAIPPKAETLAQQAETQRQIAQWLQAEVARSAEEAKSKGVSLGKLHKDDSEPFTYKMGAEFDKANQTATQMLQTLIQNPHSLFTDEAGNFSPAKAHSFFLRAALWEQNIAPSIADRYRLQGIASIVNGGSNPSAGAVTSKTPLSETTGKDPNNAAFEGAMKMWQSQHGG